MYSLLTMSNTDYINEFSAATNSKLYRAWLRLPAGIHKDEAKTFLQMQLAVRDPAVGGSRPATWEEVRHALGLE